MKLIISIAICILGQQVNCQAFFGLNEQYNQQYNQQYDQQYNQQYNQQYRQQYNQQNDQQYNEQYNQQNDQQYNQQYTQQNDQQYTGSSRAIYPTTKAQNIIPYLNYTTSVNSINPTPNTRFRSNIPDSNLQVTDRNGYLQAISRNDNNIPAQQFQNNQQPVRYDDGAHFLQSNEQQPSTPFGEISSPNYNSAQQNNAVFSPLASQPENFESLQQQAVADANTIKNLVSNALSSFGLNLFKIASQLNPGNVIVSPTSIATLLALLQQGATGQAQQQITNSLNMSPETSKTIFGVIAANMTKRNSQNILSIANKLYVSDTFELNNNFKTLAIRTFLSEVSALSFALPLVAIQQMNAWVASKTNYKITNLLAPGAVSSASQLVLLNAVYFKGLWQTKFKQERTQRDTFHLSNGQKKLVPFMNMRHTFQSGYDPNSRALVTILPFEGHQYSLILILPKKSDSVNNVLSTLTTEQLLNYQYFNENEITVNIPKFTLKTDTSLNPLLRNMGITNIFGTKSELSGIGLDRTSRHLPPQISNAVHSGYLSVDEQGVTATAATAFVAIALSYDDSSITFRADRPFIAVLWDQQLSIPIFISKIEDPS